MNQNSDNKSHIVTIGGACAFWGDTLTSTTQLIASEDVNYLVYDYLAEVTLSIMAGQKLADPKQGYAVDFIRDTINPNAKELERQNIKVVANAGGVNPIECGLQLQSLLEKQKSDLKVAVVTGDNLVHLFHDFKNEKIPTFNLNEDFPSLCLTLNAYTGYAGIKKALDLGADIVITGRVADSALTLGILMHKFNWAPNDYNKMSQASLAGHLIECGTQATGGNFTDWHTVENFENIGFPIVKCHENGDFFLTKPDNTGGIISTMAVAEQLVYEIADPKNYLLPDLICDWSNVTLTETNLGIQVANSIGKPPSEYYKVAGTYPDGYKISTAFLIYGLHAKEKAQLVANKIKAKVSHAFTQANIPDFREYVWDIIGTGATLGQSSSANTKQHENLKTTVETAESIKSTEVVLKISATHIQKAALVYFSKELAQASTSLTPGLCQLSGGRPKVHPMIKLITFLTHRKNIEEQVIFNNENHEIVNSTQNQLKEPASILELKTTTNSVLQISPAVTKFKTPTPKAGTKIQLVKLCYGRSGDKGDHANIGMIARNSSYWPLIQKILTVEFVSSVFKHHLDASKSNVERFELPGVQALNFVLNHSLGGGGFASLRLDAQGKGFAQILLSQIVTIPKI